MQTRDLPRLPSIGTVHIWQIDLDREWNISPYLSSDELERFSKYRQNIHGNRFARGRRALRTLIGGYLNTSPASIQFKYCPFGKPHIKESPNDQPLFFNVSHSDATMLIGFSTSGEIGLDIEKPMRRSDETAIVGRFFSQREIDSYLSLPINLRKQGFINAWTRKEAILKATGTGLQTPLDSFSVSLDPRKPCAIQEFPNSSVEKDDWNLLDISANPVFTAALATRNKVSRVVSLNFADIESRQSALMYSQCNTYINH